MPYLVGLLVVVIIGATLCSIVQYVDDTWSKSENYAVDFDDIKDSQCL